jgi:DtxR family Mn-dependent transcriptional regulator
MRKEDVSEALSPAMQDYLKTIYRLEEDQSPASTQDLADSLEVTPASATSMIKKMAARGLLTHQPYYGVSLTRAGRQVAESLIRHHRLLELYLTEALGFGSDQVHAEAEILEHVMSAQLGEQIDRFLGRPTHDPHGSIIPPAPRRVCSQASVLLTILNCSCQPFCWIFPARFGTGG